MNELIFKTMLSLQHIFFTFMLRSAKGAFADNKQLAKSNPAVKKNKKKYKQYKKSRHSDAKQEDPKIILGTRNISCGKPRWPIFQLELFASSGFRQSF